MQHLRNVILNQAEIQREYNFVENVFKNHSAVFQRSNNLPLTGPLNMVYVIISLILRFIITIYTVQRRLYFEGESSTNFTDVDLFKFQWPLAKFIMWLSTRVLEMDGVYKVFKW